MTQPLNSPVKTLFLTFSSTLLFGTLLFGAALASAEIPEGYTELPALSDERVLEFGAPEQVLEAGVDYGAVMVTNKGTMVLDLYEIETPQTVNNFVFLARHRFYDGVVFHRVLEDFMAQTGDPTGTGTGGPGYRFDDEILPELRHDRGTLLSMANSGPGTNGSQFFMTFTETPWLDDQHTIFGEVTEGAEVLDALQRIDPRQPDTIARPDEPLSVFAEEGIALAGEPDVTVEAYLEAELGGFPRVGDTFEIEGYNGIVGRNASGDVLVGIYPQPDVIESLTIIERSAQ